ncbi:peptidoglycan/LPS O-acetylase OafA/YrhL [Thermocatellispora tengchongensis]|uniref:Peptidoglycan/LPS O-acetylase OafA/YrhL n=1 Tax=Thermocatellispora tengchongensis TaxID=1073253 RepID=A0A840PQD3_9ACTN|nr:hypothetical protein [Thermocatellispora tengchongensis]MBB5140293.1 peptidoglycan/LPS O-acetylase OafA/YrhL [Thermocatellispora tengchongensis]
MTVEEPRLSPRELIDHLEPVLSRRRRVRAVAALLAGLLGTAFVAALWLTEPGPLPGRTRLAFALFLVFCLAWAAYGGWLLTRRVPLFATEKVIAAWIALAASLVTTAVMVTIAAQRGTGVLPVLAAGAAIVAVALTLAVRAHARRAALLRRKRELGGGEEA